MENKEKVLQAMKELNKPVKTAEIAEKTGIDKKELGKIFKELKTEEKIISPKRCYYSLP